MPPHSGEVASEVSGSLDSSLEVKSMLRSLSFFVVLPLLLLPSLLTGCRSAYYSAMESFGYAKRDILVGRVEEGREMQAEASTQVQSTYDALVTLTGFEGGDIEVVYRGLEREYERSEARAEDLRASMKAIEEVAMAMFAEWRSELEEIVDAGLREESRAMLEDTRARYSELMAVMQSAVSSMEPVLQAFKDQVLFLKHNLNARAIASLENTAVDLELDVSELIERMTTSIAEADAFIASMRT